MSARGAAAVLKNRDEKEGTWWIGARAARKPHRVNDAAKARLIRARAAVTTPLRPWGGLQRETNLSVSLSVVRLDHLLRDIDADALRRIRTKGLGGVSQWTESRRDQHGTYSRDETRSAGIVEKPHSRLGLATAGRTIFNPRDSDEAEFRPDGVSKLVQGLLVLIVVDRRLLATPPSALARGVPAPARGAHGKGGPGARGSFT